jgi:predicted cobalt transporter CbtA
MSSLRSIALAVVVLALGACGHDEAAPADVADSASAAPAATPAAPAPAPKDAASVASADEEPLPPADPGGFHIVSVLLGNAVDAQNVVLVDSAVFARRDPIYASVLSSGASQGLKVSARWLGPDGVTFAETAQPLVPTTPTSTTFSVSNPQGWPVGDYQLQIGINGHFMEKKNFKVR